VIRELDVAVLRETTPRLLPEINYSIPPDVLASLRDAAVREEAELGRQTLEQLVRNYEVAATVRNARPDLDEFEATLLDRINALGIGPQGVGGVVTALAVNVEVFPTHIAGLPVAVNLGCHSLRRVTISV
jgi:tartrate dehydratase alpha subunit/fumarate hydratase class I-like protein